MRTSTKTDRKKAAPPADFAPSGPTPPADLSYSALEWWHRLQREFGIIDPPGLLQLETVARSFDRAAAAAAEVQKHGLLVKGAQGQLVPNPAARIETAARQTMLLALRHLGLDVVPPGPVGRPPGS